MNEYTKTIKLAFELDNKSLDNAEKELHSLGKESVTNTLKKNVEQIQKSSMKAFLDTFKQQFEAFGGNGKFNRDSLFTHGAKELKGVLDSALSGLKGIFVDAWDELKNILSFSRLSNQETRDLMFTYGFDSSQAYGFDKASSLMGIRSEEDLMYMTPDQSDRFRELMSNYTEKYSKLYDTGFFNTLEDFQYEMAEFKDEITMEVVQFFMDNKDTIKDGMIAIMKLADFTIDSLGWLVNFFGGRSTISASARAQNTTQIIDNARSVNVNNTFNEVAQKDRSWLANEVQNAYEQVLKSLT